MKEKLVKATYMCVGALIAFTAYLLGNVNNNINAQSQPQLPVIDKIVVRQLEVVDANGNTIAVLGKRDLAAGMADILRVYDGTGKSTIVLAQSTDGGFISVFGKEGKSGASLGTYADGGIVAAHGKEGGQSFLQGATVKVSDKDGATRVVLNTDANGGNVFVAGKNGKSGVVLDISTDGGSVSVANKNGKIGTALSTDKNGGWMSILNNGGQETLQIGVTDTGSGAIRINDKFGYIIGSVP